MGPCPFCGSSSLVLSYEGTSGKVRQCRTCFGVVNEPAGDTDRLYDENYYRDNYLPVALKQQEEFRICFSFIKEHLSEGSLMDYGCGTGNFLKIAEEEGFENNLGVDVSAQALALAKDNVNDTTKLSFPKKSIEGQYQIISFVDSIAHIPNVKDVVGRLVSENLADGGFLFFRTPRFNRLYFAYVKIICSVLPERYRPQFYFLSNRYLLFTDTSMVSLLEGIGAQVCSFSKHREYSRSNNIKGIKPFLKDLVFKKIPRFLNPDNSMYVLARIAKGKTIEAH